MAKKKAIDKTIEQWLIPHLRNISRTWPQKNVTANRARVKVEVGIYKNGNPILKTLFKCNMCKDNFDRSEIDIDHIVPVANIEGFKDWNSYIEAMFCPADGLQCLCKSCHYIKTQAESEDRRKKPKKINKLKNNEEDDNLY